VVGGKREGRGKGKRGAVRAFEGKEKEKEG